MLLLWFPLHTHLMNVPQPKGGITVTFSKDAPSRKVEKTVKHLEQLSVEASAPMEVVSKPSKSTTIKAKLQPAQDDSDVDLETGEICIPMLPIFDTLVYKTDAEIEDYKAFASVMAFRESSYLGSREGVSALRPFLLVLFANKRSTLLFSFSSSSNIFSLFDSS